MSWPGAAEPVERSQRDGLAHDLAQSATGRVVVTWVDYDVDDPETGGLLRQAGLRIKLAPKHGARTPAEMALLIRDADAAIVSTDPFDRSVLQAASRLRVIARVGVGTDSIDLATATKSGVVVTTTPGANRETTADHALAMILAAVRRIVEHDASVRRGEWDRTAAAAPWDLHGTTVGLVGFGAIGKAVARRLEGFGTRLLISDPALADDGRSDIVPLDELLERSDVVSLHLPLEPATRHILSAPELARMGPHAILVNTSRGALVDERALVDALVTGRLRGAALDVFSDEPHVPDALRALSNVVLTPHVGGLSDRSISRMTRQATRDVLAVLTGVRRLDSIVNPAALEHPRHARRPLTTTEPSGPHG